MFFYLECFLKRVDFWESSSQCTVINMFYWCSCRHFWTIFQQLSYCAMFKNTLIIILSIGRHKFRIYELLNILSKLNYGGAFEYSKGRHIGHSNGTLSKVARPSPLICDKFLTCLLRPFGQGLPAGRGDRRPFAVDFMNFIFRVSSKPIKRASVSCRD